MTRMNKRHQKQKKQFVKVIIYLWWAATSKLNAWETLQQTCRNVLIKLVSGGSSVVPLIGPESGICSGQNILQLGAEFIEFNGKSGEAVVQLIVCGHGAWQEEKTTKTYLIIHMLFIFR